MAEMPVSAKTFFSDFSFDLLDYTVVRNSHNVCTLKGLTNKDEDGVHIAFMYGGDLAFGDVLLTGNRQYVVKRIIHDTYNGIPELTKAYY